MQNGAHVLTSAGKPSLPRFCVSFPGVPTSTFCQPPSQPHQFLSPLLGPLPLTHPPHCSWTPGAPAHWRGLLPHFPWHFPGPGSFLPLQAPWFTLSYLSLLLKSLLLGEVYPVLPLPLQPCPHLALSLPLTCFLCFPALREMPVLPYRSKKGKPGVFLWFPSIVENCRAPLSPRSHGFHGHL